MLLPSTARLMRMLLVLQPLLQAAGNCNSLDVKMFCFSDTFAAKAFKGTRAWIQASKECFDLLPEDSQYCHISEKALHQAFTRAVSSDKFVVLRQNLFTKCHACAAAKSKLIPPVATLPPTPASDLIGAAAAHT